MGKTWVIIWAILAATTLSFGSEEGADDDEDAVEKKVNDRFCTSAILKSAETPFEKALMLASSGEGGPLVAFIKSQKFSEEQKFFLWKWFLDNKGRAAVAMAAEIDFSLEAQESAITLIAQKFPHDLEEQIPTWKQKPIQVTAIRALARTQSVAAFVQYLPQEALTETIISQIKAGHGSSYHQLMEAQFARDNTAARAFFPALIEFAKQNEILNGQYRIRYDISSLSEEQRYQIGVAITSDDSCLANLSWVQDLALTNRNFKIDLAGRWFALHFNHNNNWTRINAEQFGLTTADHPEIVLPIIRHVKKSLIRQRPQRDQVLMQITGGHWLIKPSLYRAIYREIFFKDVLGTLAASVGRENLDGVHLVEENGEPDLTTILTEFSKEHPDVLPPDFVAALWDKVRSPEVTLILLTEFFAQAENNRPSNYPKESLELMCNVTGLNYCDVAASSISKNPTVLYGLALDIQKGLRNPAFKGIAIEPSVYDNKERFLVLLRDLRNVLHLTGNGTKVWRKLLKDTGIADNGITEETLEARIASTQQLLVTALKASLNGINTNFTYEEFIQLEQAWGNIEPVTTLVSRFQSAPAWQKETPILLKVFEESLAGNFANYKFKGIDKLGRAEILAQDQLAMLGELQKLEWMKPRAMATLLAPLNPETLAGEEKARTDALKIIREEIVPAFAGIEVTGEESEDVQQWKKQILIPVLTGPILKGEPHDLVTQFLQDIDASEIAGRTKPVPFLADSVLKHLVREGVGISEIQGGLRVLRSLISFHAEHLPKMDVAPLKKSLSNAERALNVKTQSNDGFILTVMNSDPKFLLTVGDLVAVTSCQNYRTGGHIETLLGYVIDANVQAMASFQMKVSDFERRPDFSEVISAISAQTPMDIRFDGNRKIATFVIHKQDGDVTVVSKELDKALLRQMVKLGQANNGTRVPVIRLERAYQNAGGLLNAMQQNHTELAATVATAIGGVANGGCTIPQSRNPGGVYTDLGGGIKTTAYAIP